MLLRNGSLVVQMYCVKLEILIPRRKFNRAAGRLFVFFSLLKQFILSWVFQFSFALFVGCGPPAPKYTWKSATLTF